MQPALRSPLPDASLAVFPVNGEKPHQGVWRRKTAPYRVRHRCNLRNALGLRAGQHRNRVRSRCSGEQYDSDLGLYYLRARYYNPNTGRFLSRDPEDGNAKIPATLHKYLYAGGDPINRIDPTGRDDAADYSSLLANESWKTQLEMRATAAVVDDILECIEVMLSFGFSQGYIDKFCWPL
jgi:RHS repeat-associated protein